MRRALAPRASLRQIDLPRAPRTWHAASAQRAQRLTTLARRPAAVLRPPCQPLDQAASAPRPRKPISRAESEPRPRATSTSSESKQIAYPRTHHRTHDRHHHYQHTNNQQPAPRDPAWPLALAPPPHASRPAPGPRHAAGRSRPQHNPLHQHQQNSTELLQRNNQRARPQTRQTPRNISRSRSRARQRDSSPTQLGLSQPSSTDSIELAGFIEPRRGTSVLARPATTPSQANGLFRLGNVVPSASTLTDARAHAAGMVWSRIERHFGEYLCCPDPTWQRQTDSGLPDHRSGTVCARAKKNIILFWPSDCALWPHRLPTRA
jgi:hypothetical protein